MTGIESSLPSDKTLNDLELRIDALERQNFDLKMQLFYQSQKGNGFTLTESPNKINELNSYMSNPEVEAELSNLRNENLRLKRLVNDFEAEKLHHTITNGIHSEQVTIGNQGSKSSKLDGILLNTLTSSIPSDMTQIEENRKRERRAALAVADHDRAVITHLEKEINRLLLQHNQDVDLVKRCSEQVGNLTEEITRRNNIIESRDAEIVSLSAKVDMLTDRLKHQDLIIKESQDKTNILLKNLAERDALLLASPKNINLSETQSVISNNSSVSTSTPNQEWKVNKSKSSNGKSLPGSTPEMKETTATTAATAVDISTPNTNTTPSLAERISLLKSSQEKKVEKPNKSKPQIGKLNTKFVFGSNSSSNASNSNSSDHSSSPDKNISTPSAQSIVKNISQTFDKVAQAPTSVSSSSSVTTGPNIKSEISVTSINNISEETKTEYSLTSDALSEEINKLKRENGILRDQLERGRNMLKSHEEILQKIQSSAEELTLLEAEEIARLSNEIDRLTKENKRYKEKSISYEHEIQKYSQKIVELERTQSVASRFSFETNSAISPQKIKNQERLIEMYKQREVELLNALETVVIKCQELESKSVTSRGSNKPSKIR